MKFVHDSDYDTNSDDEFTDDQYAKFLSNLVVEHEKLIKSYLKDHDILKVRKTKIDMLNVENTNVLDKIRFLESEHHSLLEKNNALTQEIKRNKSSLFVNEVITLKLKCLMNFLINAKPMVINEVWDILIKMKLPLVEQLCLSKVNVQS